MRRAVRALYERAKECCAAALAAQRPMSDADERHPAHADA